MPDLIEDPVFHYRCRFERNGDVLRGEFWVEPGGGGKIEHMHPQVEERFEILEGEITYRADGRTQRAVAGDRFTVPAGTRHMFRNTGSGVLRLVADMEPGLNMDELFRDAAALARAGRWTTIGRYAFPTGPRGLMELAEFLDRYRDIFVATFPPQSLQRIAIPALARRARHASGAAA